MLCVQQMTIVDIVVNSKMFEHHDLNKVKAVLFALLPRSTSRLI